MAQNKDKSSLAGRLYLINLARVEQTTGATLLCHGETFRSNEGIDRRATGNHVFEEKNWILSLGKDQDVSSASLLTIVLCLVFPTHSPAATGAGDVFNHLEQRLVSDGFSRQKVSMVFRPKPVPLFKTISQTLRIRESKLNYDQFLEPSIISRARDFRQEHMNLLSQAEEVYGVDQYVIVAILLVETHFGRYTGQTPTLAILSTFALMDQKIHRDRVWALLPREDRGRLGRDAFDQKLTKRAQWAYEELCALLRLSDTQNLRIESCRGSVMGAIGWAQFLPTSVVRYGVDGNRDGRVDLFQPADAIFSVANYLRGYGWREAKTRSSQEEVIYAYNHSQPYVQTILGVADRVRKLDQARTGPSS